MEWGRAESLEHWYVPKNFLWTSSADRCVCLIATTISKNEAMYLPKKKIWLTKIFLEYFIHW